MIDIMSALETLAEVDSKVSLGSVVADVMTIYPLYASGKFSLSALIANKTLQPDLAAVARMSNLAATILLDPVHGPQLEALLQSVDGS